MDITEVMPNLRRPQGAAIHIRSLVRTFGTRTVLNGLDLDVPPGEFVVLLGRSGSGKSTLLKALARIDHGCEGSGLIDVPRSRAVVFQDSRLLPWLDVLGNVTLGLRSTDARAQARKLLDEVGLSGRERSWPNALSGGEAQRAALARALARQPRLLLADEPFGALDALTRLRMHKLLLDLVGRYHPTLLFVTHDVDEAVALADRILVLDNGKMVLDRRLGTPRPRSRDSQESISLRRELLAALGLEGID